MASKGGDRIMELKNRSQYLDKLISVQDMEVIKVVTGIRRCGKSSLLKLMMAHLREQGVMEEQILSMNFESMPIWTASSFISMLWNAHPRASGSTSF